MPDDIGSTAKYSAFLAAPSAHADSYRALQEDRAVTAVDWQDFHAWTDGATDFNGLITIRDRSGADVATSTWLNPTDPAADHSLSRIGWRRTGPWEPDRLGRRDAPVARILTEESAQESAQQSAL